MSTAPVFQTAERRVRAARPPLPRLRTVLLEQVRATGHALRGPSLVVAALFALVTLWAVPQFASGEGPISLNAWPTQLPGLIGALLPIAVWARDERFGPGFLWTLPVDRRRHALAKVFAGWVWLMAAVALFVLWILTVTSATGGRALPPESLQLTTFEAAASGAIDPASLRSVRWAPGPWLWAVPFTAATATYLLGSALALGSRHPVRWVIGAAIAYTLLSVASTASAQLGVGWLTDAPEGALRPLVHGRYGLDALLTGRLESLGVSTRLTTGERVMVWWGVPTLADWGNATLLWTGAGLLALWAAASRHRERRRR